MSQNKQSIASNPEFNKNMAGLPLSQYRAVTALVDAELVAVRAVVMENEVNQRESFEAFVRSGASPVPPSEVEKPLPDGSYRTSGANNAWVFWQAAQANLVNQSKR